MHPVAFYSKTFNDTEKCYDVHDREMLGIIRGFQEWRHFLEGTVLPVEVLTDHKNLEYFMTSKKLNARQARWALLLSNYNFHLRYIPAAQNGKADLLSRRPDHGQDDEEIIDAPLLPPEKIRVFTEEDLFPSTLLQLSRLPGSIEAYAKETGTPLSHWKSNHTYYYYNERVYVPLSLRSKLLDEVHATPIGGHPGPAKTLDLLTRHFWWPSMTQYVQDFVHGCDLCQRSKPNLQKPQGHLIPNPIPSLPWQHISADFITGLPLSSGFDAILVVCDRYSKMTHIIPTTSSTSSLGLATLYRDNVWKLHGLPLSIISDRGPQFASQLSRSLNELLSIKTSLSTAFHPQTDGQTERTNQEVEKYLQMFVNHQQTNWSSWLAIAEFSFNNATRSSTSHSPFFLNYGLHPRTPTSPPNSSKIPALDEWLSELSSARSAAEKALKKSAEYMKTSYDKRHSPNPDYRIGEKVWLSAKNINQTRPSPKLSFKRLGPFEITKKLTPVNYELKLPPSLAIHNRFHVTLLSKYTEPFAPEQKLDNPPPIEVQGQEEFEVKEILDSRKKGRGVQFLVKWKGFNVEENSWEKPANLANAPDLIKAFYKKFPNKPRPKSVSFGA